MRLMQIAETSKFKYNAKEARRGSVNWDNMTFLEEQLLVSPQQSLSCGKAEITG